MCDYEGRPTFADVSRVSSVDEEEAMELAAQAVLSPGHTGELAGFRYRVQPGVNNAYSVIFLDCSAQAFHMRFFLFSLAAGLLCWLTVLLSLITASRWKRKD